MLVFEIMLATALAGIGSVWIAAGLSRLLMLRYTQHMLSLAAGALLATALLHLMPEALNSQADARDVFALLLGALVFFFLLDKAELWHHGHEHSHGHSGHRHEHGHRAESYHDHSHHDHSHDVHATDDHQEGSKKPVKSGGWAVLFGDSIHCFGDGILIAAAFVADVRLGLAATVAVLAHEVPHHMGDLTVLLQTSRNAKAAIFKLSCAGAVTIAGGLVGYAFAAALRDHLPYFLVVGSASFIYVALADLIPQLQHRLSAQATAAQIAWLAVGIALVAVTTGLAHG